MESQIEESIVVQPNIDGLVSAMLIGKKEGVPASEVYFAKSADNYEKPGAIIVGLPYNQQATMWFDNRRHPDHSDVRGKRTDAPSCARVIFNYYRDNEEIQKYSKLVDETDRVIKSDSLDILSGLSILSFVIHNDVHNIVSRNFNRFVIHCLSMVDSNLSLSLHGILNFEAIRERTAKYFIHY